MPVVATQSTKWPSARRSRLITAAQRASSLSKQAAARSTAPSPSLAVPHMVSLLIGFAAGSALREATPTPMMVPKGHACAPILALEFYGWSTLRMATCGGARHSRGALHDWNLREIPACSEPAQAPSLFVGFPRVWKLPYSLVVCGFPLIKGMTIGGVRRGVRHSREVRPPGSGEREHITEDQSPTVEALASERTLGAPRFRPGRCGPGSTPQRRVSSERGPAQTSFLGTRPSQVRVNTRVSSS